MIADIPIMINESKELIKIKNDLSIKARRGLFKHACSPYNNLMTIPNVI